MQCAYRRTRLPAGWVAAALLALAAPAAAQTTNWNVTTGGAWETAGNWDAGVPTTTTIAAFGPNPTAAATVTLSTLALDALGLRVTNPGGTVTINGVAATFAPGLTIGASGIDMTTAAADLTLSNFVVFLGASQTWDVRNARTLTAGTNIVLGSNTLTVNTAVAGAPTAVALNGGMSGTGGLTVTGDGQVTIGGATSNFFTGPVNVNGGILVLGKTVATRTATGSNVVNLSSGHLRWGTTTTDTLPATATLTMTGTASYNIASLNATGGLIFTSTGANHIQTYAAVNYGSSGTFTTGLNSLLTVTGTFTHSGSGTLIVRDNSDLVASAFDFTTGTGAIQMTGGGGTTIGVLDAGPGGLSLNGRTITLNTSATNSLLGSQIRLRGTLTNAGTSSITVTNVNNPFSLSLENATRTFNVANFLTMNVPLVDGGGSGAGGVTKTGTGIMVMSRPSTYTGPTTVQQGTLRINVTEALPNGTLVTLAGGNLQNAPNTTSAGFSDTLGQLTVTESSSITLGTGDRTLTFASFDTLAATKTLTVVGWTGTAGTSGTNGKLVFTDGSGWSADELSRVQFQGYDVGAQLIVVGGGVELVPVVPEPAFVLAVVAPFTVWAARRRKVRQGVTRT